MSHALAAVLAGLLAGLLGGLFAARWPRLPTPATLKLAAPRILALGAGFGLVSGLAVLAHPLDYWLIPAGAVLAYLGLTDLRRFSIPLPGLALLALLAAIDLWQGGERLERLATGIVIALVLETLRRLGRRQGLGAGDVVLAGLLGVLVNWRLASAMIAAAALAPLAIQAVSRRRGPTPFGFWLSLAGLAALALPL